MKIGEKKKEEEIRKNLSTRISIVNSMKERYEERRWFVDVYTPMYILGTETPSISRLSS